MLINLKSLSPVLVMVSSMSVPICNRFHTILANNGKITSFLGEPKEPLHPQTRNFVTIN